MENMVRVTDFGVLVDLDTQVVNALAREGHIRAEQKPHMGRRGYIWVMPLEEVTRITSMGLRGRALSNHLRNGGSAGRDVDENTALAREMAATMLMTVITRLRDTLRECVDELCLDDEELFWSFQDALSLAEVSEV